MSPSARPSPRSPRRPGPALVVAITLALVAGGIGRLAGAVTTSTGAASVDQPARRMLSLTAARLRATSFVAPGGSDAASGREDDPFRTIAHAVDVAPPGSTVIVEAGTYRGFDVTRPGISVMARPGANVVVSDASRDDVVEFDGVTSGAIVGLTIGGSTAQYGSGLKIEDSAGIVVRDSTIADNRTFGIVIVRSERVLIARNRITRNANGIEERYAGDGVVIAGNTIFDNATMVDAGRGREGINFYKSTGSVAVIGNVLHDNGTHFEVYGASNLLFYGNVTWNGQVMETGTDGLPCDGIRFIRNVGYRGSGFRDGVTNGMILRCASHMLVAHNTLDGFDQFAFDIVDGRLGEPYGGPIDGLRVVDNIVVGGRAFSIDTALPASVQIDWNHIDNTGSTALYGDHLAYVAGLGNFDSLTAFRRATGYQRHGSTGDPRFVDRAAHDYRLTAESPAIDAGTPVLDERHGGSAPDVGRFERGNPHGPFGPAG